MIFTKNRKPESATLQAIIDQSNNSQKSKTPLSFYGSLAPFFTPLTSITNKNWFFTAKIGSLLKIKGERWRKNQELVWFSVSRLGLMRLKKFTWEVFIVLWIQGIHHINNDCLEQMWIEICVGDFEGPLQGILAVFLWSICYLSICLVH